MPDVCAACFGTRVEITDRGARPCPLCAPTIKAQRAATLLQDRPARYRDVCLSRLTPRPDLHEKQESIVATLRSHPDANYYLCGHNDTGKSHFLHALLGHAILEGRRQTVYSTLYDMIERVKLAFARGGDVKHDWIRIADFQQSRHPFGLYLDDIDKARPTEFVGETVFALIDAAYAHGHQIVVTTNLHPEHETKDRDGVVRDSLLTHFSRSDPRYGEGIVRRLCNEQTILLEMY